MRNAVSLIPRRPTDRSRRVAGPRAAGVLAGLLLVLATAPVAGVGAAVPAGADPTADATGAVHPSIQYEEALAHANDTIPFTAGARVSVPFAPRSADRWTIDGKGPQTLPAGRLTGKSILDAGAGPGTQTDPARTVAPALPSGPVDAPTLDPSASIATHLAAVVDPGGLRREVFGFLPYWEIADPSTTLDWEKLSTIAYFGVGAAANGDLQRQESDGSTSLGWSGWTSSNLTSVINAAHANGARVVLTVQSFGWTSSQLAHQKALLGNDAARANLARQIAAAVRDRGADGVNLDFEPIAATYGDEFTSLVQSIRAELDAIAPGYQLTFDTMGWIGNYPIEAATAPGGADAVVIMGYDYRTGSSGTAGSVSPLGGPAFDLGDTLASYVSRIPASKVILGVPYYGRAWSTSSSALNASTVSAAQYGASVAVLYGTALDFSTQYGRQYDPVEGAAWTTYQRQNCTATYGCVTATRQLYYDDAESLASKYDLINSYDIRGVGIWALGYDGSRPELYQVLKDKFITDTIPPAITGSTVTPPDFSPNGDGHLDSSTVSVAVTGLVRYGWVVEPYFDSIAGTPIVEGTQDGTAAVAYTWDGRGQDGSPAPDGTYRITVWAADASDNRSSAQQMVTIDTQAPVLASTAAPLSISPNDDRRSDTTTLGMTSSEAVTGRARIMDTNGVAVRTWKFGAGSAGTWTWDGKDAAGKTAADGAYTFRLDGVDPAGNGTVLQTPVLVDRTIASLRWATSSFRPSARQADRLSFKLIRPATVTVAIYQGTTLVRRFWTDKASAGGTFTWSWNGRNGHRELVARGTYTASITATSAIGVSRLTRTVTVRAP
jgi:spore germination protein YaaH/flagellar hook assembly protein FlgD